MNLIGREYIRRFIFLLFFNIFVYGFVYLLFVLFLSYVVFFLRNIFNFNSDCLLKEKKEVLIKSGKIER